MPGADDRDDVVEFDARTRVEDGLMLPETAGRPEPSVALDGRQEATRMAAPPVPDPDDDEPARTVLIESPFAMPAAPPVPSGRLVVIEGNDRGKEFVLTGLVQVVGRSLDCEIVLNDPSVSRRHFQVEYAKGRWLLTDLGSGNGTRVDEQRVPTMDLAEGMRIEAGQTVLQFSGGETVAAGDEESTRAVEIPMNLPGAGGQTLLERPPRADLPPKVEPRPSQRPSPARDSSPAEALRPRIPPRIEVADVPPDDERGFPVWPVVGGAALAVVIAIAVAQFGFGVRILPLGAEPPPPVAAVDETEAAKTEALELQARANKAIQDRQWDTAIALLASSKEKDPALAGLDEAAARARDEKRASSFLSAAKDSLEKGSPEEARGLVGRIPDASVYYAEARQILSGLDAKHVDAEIETLRAAARDGRKAEARQGFVALVTDHPEDPRVLVVRDELIAAGVALDPPAPRPTAAPSGSPAAQSPEPAPALAAVAVPSASPAPARTGRLDFPRALALYDRGLFQQAASDLRSARARGEDLAKAQALADRIDRFANAYEDGKTALASKRLDPAESGLSLALRLDQEVNGRYAAEIRGLLGDTYRGRAAAAIQNTDYVLAARSAKRALSYRAEDDMAKSILDKCLVMAQKQYDAAVADSKAGRKDDARLKARTVLDIVPKGHPLEDKAAALLR